MEAVGKTSSSSTTVPRNVNIGVSIPIPCYHFSMVKPFLEWSSCGPFLIPYFRFWGSCHRHTPLELHPEECLEEESDEKESDRYLDVSRWVVLSLLQSISQHKKAKKANEAKKAKEAELAKQAKKAKEAKLKEKEAKKVNEEELKAKKAKEAKEKWFKFLVMKIPLPQLPQDPKLPLPPLPQDLELLLPPLPQDPELPLHPLLMQKLLPLLQEGAGK
ncbi:hypothetical protein Tco_1483693 [Tanacetum coccineum]